MIEFKREGRQIIMQVHSDIGWYFNFTNDRHDEPSAVLLKQHLENKLYKRLQKIREDAYNEGWRDKQRRRPKLNWFPGNL